MTPRLVSWNLRQRDGARSKLAGEPTLDIALVQDARPPPPNIASEVFPPRDVPWTTPGCSPRVTARARKTAPLASAARGAIPESRGGSLTVVDVEPAGGVVTVVSAYATWKHVVSDARRSWIISGVSALITAENDHRIIVAGDFNLARGYGDDGVSYWARRYDTVISRMEALGLRYVGPEAPNGRQADPWLPEVPQDSKNIPTYHTGKQSPATARAPARVRFRVGVDRGSHQGARAKRANRLGPERPLQREDRAVGRGDTRRLRSHSPVRHP